MLKIIRRVLRLSGNLSKRIWGSFICGFLESMFGLLPIAAVFLVLIELQNGQPITGQTWGIVIGLIAGGLILRMIFKYLVYRLQSTAGFEFVARERIALGDRLRNVPMGFFHDNSVGDITATVTTDLNFLENYSMHILDKVTMSEDTKRKVREECNITLPHFQVIMGKLRKNKVIVDGKINPRFIPNIDEETGTFQLLLLFELK